MGKLGKFVFRVLVATSVITYMGMAVVAAFAHDNTVTATSVCESNGSYTIVWQVANDYRLSELTNVIPAPHQGKILNTSVPISPYGIGTILQEGASTTQQLGISSVWSDGFARTDRGEIFLNPDNCSKAPPPPPPPCKKPKVGKPGHCHLPVKVVHPVARPHAQFRGPCGDPFYGVSLWNGVKATKDTTLIWRFVSFNTGALNSIRVKLAPGRHYRSPLVHVLGGTRQTISTASGAQLMSTTTVPPGEYGSCRGV